MVEVNERDSVSRNLNERQIGRNRIFLAVSVFALVLSVLVSVVVTRPSWSHSSSAESLNSNAPTQNPTSKPSTEASTGATTTANTGSPSSSPTATIASDLYTRFGTFEILRTVPHDTDSFTQGLQLVNGTMYESNGLYGKSNVRILDIDTGATVLENKMGGQYFGEGLTYFIHKGIEQLIQLTWKEQTGFLYDPENLNVLGNFSFDTERSEGWGITYAPDGTGKLYVTDGSHFLHVWDPVTLEESEPRIPVHLKRKEGPVQGMQVNRLNELEWDHHSNTILANVFTEDVIVRIDPETGFIRTVYNFQGLYTDRSSRDDVFNGIAVTETENVIWVTGKLWPAMYLVKLIG